MKTSKRILSVILAVMMLLSAVPETLASNDNHGEILEDYWCTCCNMHCIFYEDLTLVIDGNNVAEYSHREKFEDFSEAKKVVLSANTLIDAPELFDNFSFLESFEVDEANQYYSALDGVLFNKDKTALVKYPNAKMSDNYIIPATVEALDKASFMNSKIESITIPANIKYIGKWVFSGSSIKSVTFENGERNLIVAMQSFYMCKNLSTITLPAERVYCIHASAFGETAFYNDESNWENGVLYLDKILLATKPEKLTSEYTIKEGTTTLADMAMLIYYTGTDDGEPCDPKAIKVTFPESVDNIGCFSAIEYEDLPSNIFRIGSIGPIYITEYAVDSEFLDWYIETYTNLGEKLDLWEEKWNGEITPEAYKEYVEIMSICYKYYGWVHQGSANSSCQVNFIDEGIKGIADETFLKCTGFPMESAFFAPFTFNAIILPESFEYLGGYTTLCNDYVEILGKSLANMEEIDFNELLSGKSITFLNKDSKIFDDPNAIWEGFTICGYKNSTAHKYAIKYNRTFVDIESCNHNKQAYNYSFPATCEREGYTGDVYCQYCGKFLEEGSTLSITDHTFGEWETASYATCTKEGSERRICKVCDFEETRSTKKKNHDYSWETHSWDATCTIDARKQMVCLGCLDVTLIYIENTALGHSDVVFDGYCDNCGSIMDAVKNCKCNCHDNGILGFFFDFILLFQKLFGINKQCSCGIYHY